MKKKLTFTQSVEMFRKHWNTIADMTPEEMKGCETTIKIKRIALEKIGINEDLSFCCFCCEYANESGISCDRCPIRWSEQLNNCTGRGDGEYAIFVKAINRGEYEQAAEIARKIANLPARKIMKGEE